MKNFNLRRFAANVCTALIILLLVLCFLPKSKGQVVTVTFPVDTTWSDLILVDSTYLTYMDLDTVDAFYVYSPLKGTGFADVFRRVVGDDMGFVSTSQFLVWPDTIEEFHRAMRVIVGDDEVCFWSEAINDCFLSFNFPGWVVVDANTLAVDVNGARVEWRKRDDERSVMVDFLDVSGVRVRMFVYEFWRDTTLIR